MNNKDFVNGLFAGIFLTLILGFISVFFASQSLTSPTPSFTKMLDEWHDQKHRPAP